MHKILVIRLYFPLDAVHVSDYISPSSGSNFISCTSHSVYVGICRYVWLLCGYSHTTARRIVPAYTKCDLHHRWHYMFLTAFSIWRGFCVPGRILDPTTYQCIAETLYLGNSNDVFLRDILEVYAERVPSSSAIMWRVEVKWHVPPHEFFWIDSMSAQTIIMVYYVAMFSRPESAIALLFKWFVMYGITSLSHGLWCMELPVTASCSN